MPFDIPTTVHLSSHPTRKMGAFFRAHSRPLHSFSLMKERMGIKVPEKPVLFDFLKTFPDNAGALGNDELGNCAFAGIYRLITLAYWSLYGKLIDPNLLKTLAIKFYEVCGGYDPNAQLTPDPDNPGQMTNATDAGGDPIAIMKWLLVNGLDLPPELEFTSAHDKFSFGFQIDSGNAADIAYAASECCGAGIGAVLSDLIMRDDNTLPAVWPCGGNAVGGHFMGLAANYGGTWAGESWGLKVVYSDDFMRALQGNDLSQGNLMTVTAYIHDWMFKDGKTVLGKSLDELRAYDDQYASEVTANTPVSA